MGRVGTDRRYDGQELGQALEGDHQAGERDRLIVYGIQSDNDKCNCSWCADTIL
jgi:hypothetical protein